MDRWREAVLAEARTWVGTPWKHRARVRGRAGGGVDCAHYLIAAFAGAGCVQAFDPGPYPPDWMLHRDEERLLAVVERYASQTSAPQPADIAVWRFGRCFSHLAIVVAWPQILHAYKAEGGVVPGDGTKGLLAARERRFYALREEFRA